MKCSKCGKETLDVRTYGREEANRNLCPECWGVLKPEVLKDALRKAETFHSIVEEEEP